MLALRVNARTTPNKKTARRRFLCAVALLVGGMAIERKLSSSQETVEESLERLEHHLDEMGRERGEP